MMRFEWVRHDWGKRGIHFELRGPGVVGRAFYLQGSKRWTCSAATERGGWVLSHTYYGGSALSVRRQLERDWDKRSIGLFGQDGIEFVGP